MTLTYEILHSAGSYGGNGFNNAQLALLGVSWPPPKGWLRELAGTEIDGATWAKVMELRGVRRKQQRNAILADLPPLKWKAVITGPSCYRTTIEAPSRAKLYAELIEIAKCSTSINPASP